jgi:hypothetical protein
VEGKDFRGYGGKCFREAVVVEESGDVEIQGSMKQTGTLCAGLR